MKDLRIIRSTLIRLFGGSAKSHIILAPSLLASLHILFGHLDIKHILLSSEEYYGRAHFSGFTVSVAPPERVASSTFRLRPDVVIMSVVSWRGNVLHVKQEFAAIRKGLGTMAPLLFADYSHAGAIGFPRMRDLNADITYGDFQKWLLPSSLQLGISFFWLQDRVLYRHIAPAFRPFHLATITRWRQHQSRWLAPADVHRLADWLVHSRLRRSNLLEQHRRNMTLASRLANALGVPTPSSSMLWLDQRANRVRNPLLVMLVKKGLVWVLPTGLRVLCRTDSSGLPLPAPL